MAATDDFSGIPAYRDRAIVRDLQALAGRPGVAICGHRPLKDFPALSDDMALRRFAADIRAGDWHRIAEADPDDLAARLPPWREQGRDLLARDHAIATDFVAALDGDPAALDRLRAPEAERGYGQDWLARQVPGQRGCAEKWRGMLGDLDAFHAEMGELCADAWHEEHRHEIDAADEAYDDAVREWEERCGYR